MAMRLIDISNNTLEMCKWHHDGGCPLRKLEVDVLVSDIVNGINLVDVLNAKIDRYRADKLTLQDTDEEFPGNEVFIVGDVYETIDELMKGEEEMVKDNSLDAVKDNSLDAVKDYSTLEDLTDKTQQLHREIFNKGYAQGYAQGSAAVSNKDSDREDLYKKGLEDAWKCARRIAWELDVDTLRSAGFTVDVPDYDSNDEYKYSCKVIQEYSAAECIDKLNRITIPKEVSKLIPGMEVCHESYGRGVVTRVCNGTCAVTWLPDGTNGVVLASSLRETGKFNLGIAELVSNVKDGKEGDKC